MEAKPQRLAGSLTFPIQEQGYLKVAGLTHTHMHKHTKTQLRWLSRQNRADNVHAGVHNWAENVCSCENGHKYWRTVGHAHVCLKQQFVPDEISLFFNIAEHNSLSDYLLIAAILNYFLALQLSGNNTIVKP